MRDEKESGDGNGRAGQPIPSSSLIPRPSSLSFSVLHAPKEEHSEDEYEDACAVADGGTPDAPVVTAALADGASSSVFARQWARLLVGHFSSVPFADGETWSRVAGLGQAWRREVGTKKLAWYAQEKLAQGAHASLLVVTWDVAGRRWSARAVGDTCLFVVRQDRLHHAFPVGRSTEFGNRPDLVPTEVERVAPDRLPPVHEAADAFEDGDRFLLMTDALAAWFLRTVEAGARPWETLPVDPAAFAPWLRAQRESGSLHNDDVTLLEAVVRERPEQAAAPAPAA